MTSTSGNSTADRRTDMAMQLRARGDVEAAIDLMQQTLELVPNWPEGRFILAKMQLEAGQTETGIGTLRAYLLLDPADSLGASAQLATLGATADTHDLPSAYVERLFDQYAPRFDKALVDGLKYSAPQQIRTAIDTHFPQRRFDRALDLGCGTGLMGAAIRDITTKLEGVDLSAGMLTAAKRKNVYDNLDHASLLDALRAHASTYDLVLAADVLVYVGNLAHVMSATEHAMTKSGLFVFSVQAGDADFRLGPDQRFSHSEAYIRASLCSARLSLIQITNSSFRQERNIDVPGFLVVAAKPT